MASIAVLNIAYRGDDNNFQRTNTRVQSGLDATGESAEKAGSAVAAFAQALRVCGAVMDVFSDTSKGVADSVTVVSRAFTNAQKSLGKFGVGLESTGKLASRTSEILGVLDVALASTGRKLLDVGEYGTVVSDELKVLAANVKNLNKAFLGDAAAAYSERLDATSIAANATEERVMALTGQVALLNAEIAKGRALSIRTPALDGGGGGGRSAGAMLTSVERRSKQVGTALTKYLTIPILGAGVASTVLSAQFETSMGKVQNLAGTSKSQMESWKDSILKMAPDLGKTPNELAKGLFFVASEGIRGAKAMEILDDASKMSAIGMGDVQTNVKGIVFSLHDYAEMHLTAAQASDVLTAAVRTANVSTESFTGNLGKFLLLGAHMQIPFAQMAGAMAVITRSGANASQSATGLNRVLLTLEKPTVQAKKELALLAKATGDASLNMGELRAEAKDNLYGALMHLYTATKGNDEAFAKVFGTANGLTKALAILSGKTSDTKKAFNDVANSAGVVKDAFAETKKQIGQQWGELLAQLDVDAIGFGKTFLPIMKNVLKGVMDLAKAFGNLSPAAQENTVKALLLAAVLGPLFKVIGGGITVVKLLKDGLNLLVATAPKVIAWGVATSGAEAAVSDAAVVATSKIGLLRSALMAVCGSVWTISLGIVGAGVALDAWMLKTGGDDVRQSHAEWNKEYASTKTAGQLAARAQISRNGINWARDSAGKSGFGYSVEDFNNAQDQMQDEGERNRFAARSLGIIKNYKKSDKNLPALPFTGQIGSHGTVNTGEHVDHGIRDDGSGTKKKKGRKDNKYEDADRENDQRLQSLRDKVSSLAQAVRLYGKDSESAAVADEALYGEFATHQGKVDGLAAAFAKLKTIKNSDTEHGAQSLFGTSYGALSEGGQLQVQIYELTRLQEARKKDADSAKEWSETVKSAISSANESSVQLAIARLDPLDYDNRMSMGKYGLMMSAIKDPKMKSAIRREAMNKHQLDVNERTSEFKMPEFDHGDEGAAAYKQDKDDHAKFDLPVFEDGSEAVAKNLKNYTTTMRGLVKQVLEYSKATRAAKIDAAEFDEEGMRMSLQQAGAVVTLQDYVAQLKTYHEQISSLAAKAGGTLSTMMGDFFENGTRDLGKRMLATIRSAISGVIVELAQSKMTSWFERALGGGKPSSKGVEGLGGATGRQVGGGGVLGQLGGIAGLIQWGTSQSSTSNTTNIGAPYSPDMLKMISSVFSSLPHFAGGGDIGYGTPSWVGEDGPELFMPRHSGTIVPNGQASSGGGDTHNYHLHMHMPPGYSGDRRTADQAGRSALQGARMAHANSR